MLAVVRETDNMQSTAGIAWLLVMVTGGLLWADEQAQLSEDSPEVKQMVLLSLREPTGEEVEQVKKLLKSMAAEDSKERERATAEFLESKVYYLSLIYTRRDVVRESDFSREEKSRLEPSFEGEQLRPTVRMVERVMKFISSKGLKNQAGYLIALLKETQGRDREAVADRLEKITRQKLGLDPAAWEKWLAKQKVLGRFEQLSAQVGDLVRLTIADGKLRLDQKPDWKSAFGRLRDAAGRGSRRSRSSGDRDFSAAFDSGGFQGALSVKEQTIRIELAETMGLWRRLAVFDDGAGRLRVVLSSAKDGGVLIIHQRADGHFAVGQADAVGSVAYRAESFDAFCRTHRQYVEGQLFPRLGRLGVGLPELDYIPIEAEVAAEQAMPPEDPGQAHWQKGPLEEIDEDIAHLIGLTADRKGLCFDRRHWERELKGVDLAQLRTPRYGSVIYRDNQFMGWPEDGATLAKAGLTALRRFQIACTSRWERGGSGSSSGFGGGGLQKSFRIHNALRGELKINQVSGVEINLSEDASPHRAVQVRDDGKGAVQISVTGAEDGSLLLINQGANGFLSVVEARKDNFFVAGEESYKRFCKKYGPYVSGRLFGYLRHFGIVTPLHPYSEAVRDAVLLDLTGPTDRDTQEAQGLIKQLNDKEYSKRQEASATLTHRFPRYQQALEAARQDGDLAPETKFRLEEIFGNAPAVEKLKQMVSDMKLAEDVEYLIDLLAQSKGANRKAVAAQLRKLSGQKFGEDPGPWQRWWTQQAQQKAQSSPETTKTPSTGGD